MSEQNQGTGQELGERPEYSSWMRSLRKGVQQVAAEEEEERRWQEQYGR